MCRAQDGGNVLWSYIVLETARLESWLAEQHASSPSGEPSTIALVRSTLRNYLKSKLPVYAVPSAIMILDRMPLNPNGKIDKPALPLPSSADQSTAISERSTADAATRTPTESLLAHIWSNLLGTVAAETIGPEDSFFDLGGHSLIVTRLPFAVRQKFGAVDIPLQSIQDHARLRDYAAQIDQALDPQTTEGKTEQAAFYSIDARESAKLIPADIPTAHIDPSATLTALLTGATGFLGAFLLANLLSRPQIGKVFAHVRAKTNDAATQRIRQTCTAYGLWNASWETRLVCIAGDLEQEHLGVADVEWSRLVNEVDLVIANGARV